MGLSAYILTGYNSLGKPRCLSLAMSFRPASSKICLNLASDLVTEESVSSKSSVSVGVLFSLTTIVPLGCKPTIHLFRNATSSASGRCPTHHWHQISQYLPASGVQSCIPTSYICPIWPLSFSSANSTCICSIKGFTGSTRSILAACL
uniref:ORF YBR1730 n=1 Tax=Saccharomyces cerevisiae TaxID=4932 RepID=E9PA36_YEASX|nr:unnamed protein product [Saccharomyces cerevisiae]